MNELGCGPDFGVLTNQPKYLNMKTLKQTTAFIVLTLALATISLAGDEGSHWQKAYPPAQAGEERHVLHLATEADESALKVELIVGKVIETDGVNRYSLGGKITAGTVKGWGYPRYDATVGQAASTLIGVIDPKPPVKKFVAIGGEPYLIRYNSKLPVVVYVPEGFEVRYRIWKVSSEPKPMDKG
jgi:ecotin